MITSHLLAPLTLHLLQREQNLQIINNMVGKQHDNLWICKSGLDSTWIFPHNLFFLNFPENSAFHLMRAYKTGAQCIKQNTQTPPPCVTLCAVLSRAVTQPCNEGYKSAPWTALGSPELLDVHTTGVRQRGGSSFQHQGRADSDSLWHSYCTEAKKPSLSGAALHSTDD